LLPRFARPLSSKPHVLIPSIDLPPVHKTGLCYCRFHCGVGKRGFLKHILPAMIGQSWYACHEYAMVRKWLKKFSGLFLYGSLHFMKYLICGLILWAYFFHHSLIMGGSQHLAKHSWQNMFEKKTVVKSAVY